MNKKKLHKCVTYVDRKQDAIGSIFFVGKALQDNSDENIQKNKRDHHHIAVKVEKSCRRSAAVQRNTAIEIVKAANVGVVRRIRFTIAL